MSLFFIIKQLIIQILAITFGLLTLIATSCLIAAKTDSILGLFILQIFVFYILIMYMLGYSAQQKSNAIIKSYSNFLYFRHKDLASEQSKLLQFITDDFAKCGKFPKVLVNFVLKYTDLNTITHFVDGLFNNPFIKIAMLNNTIIESNLLNEYVIKTKDNVELFYFTKNTQDTLRYDITVNAKELTLVLVHDNKFYRDLFIRHLNGMYWEPTISMVEVKSATVLKLVTTNESN